MQQVYVQPKEGDHIENQTVLINEWLAVQDVEIVRVEWVPVKSTNDYGRYLVIYQQNTGRVGRC